MRRKFGIPTQRIAGGLLAVGMLAALQVPSADAKVETVKGRARHPRRPAPRRRTRP